MTGWDAWGFLERRFWCTLGADNESEKALRFLARSAEGFAEEKQSSASSSSLRLRFAADREVQ